MREKTTRTVVIGSGCAGLNGADWLYDLGERDFLLVTEDMRFGTSRNTGSDKQTYYKLALAGDEPDSVGSMAATLHGPDTHGDLALCEAAASAECFFKLVRLGVPFPQNDYGEYVGYQTDHDTTRRATSAGPLTSRYMTEALEKSVRKKPIEILDHTVACRILTDDQGVRGVLCYEKDARDWLLIRCAHVMLCTGGPAHIYRDSVYPTSQRGMSGLALDVGAAGANLHCWQYGLASVGFRWNVSGSYQQSLPRYVSVDESGREREFLLEDLAAPDALNRVFLKGYQWPFDPAKQAGSSRIDILVKRETDRGRRVYLDYRRDPTGYDPGNLTPEARDYLQNCGALTDTPLKRLRAINAPAIRLYADHGIDLEKEMLEIKVCAQHHSGGIAVDENWQSSVPGLYVCGEAAGTFGKRRPGGSALNSTQAGSMRAARHIALKSGRQASQLPLKAELPPLPAGDIAGVTARLQGEMSRCAAFLRDREGMRALLEELEGRLAACEACEVRGELLPRIFLRDLMVTQRAVLSAMLLDLDGDAPGVVETLSGVSRRVPARPRPQRDLWFERVWQKQLREAQRGGMEG